MFTTQPTRIFLILLAATALALLAPLSASAQEPSLPGAGGTVPADFVGVYALERLQSPDHTVTITPYGISSNLCRENDCVDGSLNFTRVQCEGSGACAFVSNECVGSMTRTAGGVLLITAAPAPGTTAADASLLCRGLGGRAVPEGGAPVAEVPVPLVVPTPTPIPVPVAEPTPTPTPEPTPVAEPTPTPTPTPTAEPTEAMCAALDGLSDDYTSRLRVPVEGAHVLGPEDAPVTIVEFSDFQCPYCARVVPTLESLVEEFGDRIRIAFRHNPLPFHSDAPLASQAALAAGEQGKFWEMHNLLFENQRALDRASIEGYAESLGLDMAAFRTYLDQSSGQETIDADQALAAQVGARGTPNFFINGRSLRGAQPIERFRDMINEELTLADRAAEAGLPNAQLYACIMARASESAPSPTPTAPEEPRVVDPPPLGDAPVVGPEDAPVTIIAFSDFECPFCSRVLPTLEQVRETYPDQVRIAFKHFPLPFHSNAHAAAEASVAAHAQGQFWPFHDLLFSNQRALTRADLESYAEQLGLDMMTFRAALDGGALSAQVDADMEQGRAAGVSGTPSFLINGELLVGAQPFERFREVIERHLGDSE